MSQYINCGASSIRQCFVAAVRPAKCRLRNPQLHPRLAGHTAAQASDSGPAPLTDASIPEGHRGLHESLYGDGGAEVHSSGADAHSGGCRFREGEDDGTALLPVDSYLSTRGGERPVGVFAIYDSRRNLQYVSYSRNMVLSVRALASRVGEDRCSFVRVMVFANRAMQSRSALQREADNWLKEAGTLPPGNGAESDLWGGVESERAAAMSADEAAEYEEKKTKMQLAMGEKIGAGGDEDSEARREKLRAAIERSDWSEVIEGQTAETVDAGRQQADKQPVVTPFARASVHREIGNETAETEKPAMTIEAVDRALDEVRPYLIADGGNVDVVSVENGVIALQLQVSYSCPQKTMCLWIVTLKVNLRQSALLMPPD